MTSTRGPGTRLERRNSGGHRLIFSSTLFDVRDSELVKSLLNAAPAFARVCDNGKECRYHWLKRDAATSGSKVQGVVRIVEKQLNLEPDSRERLEDGRLLLGPSGTKKSDFADATDLRK